MSEDQSRDDPASRPTPRPQGEGETARDPAREASPETWLERLLGRLGLKTRETLRDELEVALAESGEHAFTPLERAMLRNVLGLHRVRVDDAMVPRADIVAVASDVTLGELLATFRTAGHSRLPVYGDTLDDPQGMVHIRDFLDYLAKRAETGEDGAVNLGLVDLSARLSGAEILRPVLFVPPSMPAIDLLVRMQATRTHMALVIDEYGGTDGLVSIEDLVEMVVGDIEDEHDDQDAEMIVEDGKGGFLADARAGLEEVSAALGVDLAAAAGEEVDTIGGLIVTLAGRVPSRGELLAGPDGLEFEVVDADPRRVKRVRILRSGAADEHGGRGGDPADSPVRPAPDR